MQTSLSHAIFLFQILTYTVENSNKRARQQLSCFRKLFLGNYRTGLDNAATNRTNRGNGTHETCKNEVMTSVDLFMAYGDFVFQLGCYMTSLVVRQHGKVEFSRQKIILNG